MEYLLIIIVSLLAGDTVHTKELDRHSFRNNSPIPRKFGEHGYVVYINNSASHINVSDVPANMDRSGGQGKPEETIPFASNEPTSVEYSQISAVAGMNTGNTEQNTYEIPKPVHISTGFSAKTLKTHHGCKLAVIEKSKSVFERNVLKHSYNFVHMRLSVIGVNVSEAHDVIGWRQWIWTYKGVNGAHQYLFLPNDFGYLSFGLLWAYTLVEPMDIVLNATDASLCNDFVVGEGITDNVIGDALGDMTGSTLTHRSDNYNSSYWCYSVRLYVESDAVYFACKHSICTMQTIEYRCCKFKIDLVTRKRRVECQKEHYHFDSLWWLLPILIGEICFAFYPFLLTNIGCKVSKLQKRRETQQWEENERLRRMTSSQSEGSTSISVSIELQSVLEMSVVIRKHSKPVTLTSTLLSPICRCDVNSKLFSRLIRVMIILLPMTLSVIRVILDYRYANVFVQKAVSKGALVGFSSVLAGVDISGVKFLRILGGPCVAVPLYVLFGCFLILLPYDLEELLEGGLFELNGVSSSPILLSIDGKEKIGGVEIRKSCGFRKVHNYLLAQLYVLLNWRFWRLTMKLFVTRLTRTMYTAIRWRVGRSWLAKLVVLLLTPPYVAVCVVELVFTVFFFAFPVISCIFILLKAYIGAAIEWLSYRPAIVRWVARLLFLPLLAMFIFTWYMYCIIFFDGFVFLSKIAMFTYSGTIAYPKVSYGYIILSFMAVYYLVESVNDFGTGYQELIRISIEACEKLESRAADKGMPLEILHDNGIQTELFDVIIERHRPRRIQVVSTFLKFGLVLFILLVSIELLSTFDKLQDLSLVSHVFTVLFICALPKIVKNMCIKPDDKRRKILKRKLMRTVDKYMKHGRPDDVFSYDSPARGEYECLRGDDRVI